MVTCLTRLGHILIVALALNFHQKVQKSPARQAQKYLLEASNRFPPNVSSIASSRFR